MRPLDPAVLVAVELLGVAAEVAGVGLIGHGGYLLTELGTGCFQGTRYAVDVCKA